MSDNGPVTKKYFNGRLLIFINRSSFGIGIVFSKSMLYRFCISVTLGPISIICDFFRRRGF